MPLIFLLALAGVGIALAMTGKKSGAPTGGQPGASGTPSPGATPGMSTTPSSAAGMTPAQIAAAVSTALQVETNSANLREFANSLLPDYAQYATQLNARAAQLDAAGVQPSPAGQQQPLPPPPPAPPPPVPATPLAPPPAPVVVPNQPATPEMFPAPGSTAFINTHDTGPSGNLNVRDVPDSSGTSLTQVGHGTSVTILGDPQNGWYPVQTPAGVQGYASGQYLSATPPPDSPGGGVAGQELVAQEGQALASGSSA